VGGRRAAENFKADGLEAVIAPCDVSQKDDVNKVSPDRLPVTPLLPRLPLNSGAGSSLS
jgi:hypothetical protein